MNTAHNIGFKALILRKVFVLFFGLLLLGCFSGKYSDQEQENAIQLDTLRLFDKSRNRTIPVAFYKPLVEKPPIIIFNHGYGENQGLSYLNYSYLTEFLASKGFFVASIQHELPTDSLIPSTGNPQVVRRPFWERGSDNIRFVIEEINRRYPDLDNKHISLIGHSNGGDMTALFPQKYPGLVDKIITLDNRRMALPRSNSLKVYSLRSSDQPADDGVLPSESEMEKFKIKILRLSNTKHNEMDDHANDEQRREIQTYVLSFLTEK